MNWYIPIFVLLMCAMLTHCAPLMIAAGVTIEHDEWCKVHPYNRHCRW